MKRSRPLELNRITGTRCAFTSSGPIGSVGGSRTAANARCSFAVVPSNRWRHHKMGQTRACRGQSPGPGIPRRSLDEQLSPLTFVALSAGLHSHAMLSAGTATCPGSAQDSPFEAVERHRRLMSLQFGRPLLFPFIVATRSSSHFSPTPATCCASCTQHLFHWLRTTFAHSQPVSFHHTEATGDVGSAKGAGEAREIVSRI